MNKKVAPFSKARVIRDLHAHAEQLRIRHKLDPSNGYAQLLPLPRRNDTQEFHRWMTRARAYFDYHKCKILIVSIQDGSFGCGE